MDMRILCINPRQKKHTPKKYTRESFSHVHSGGKTSNNEVLFIRFVRAFQVFRLVYPQSQSIYYVYCQLFVSVAFYSAFY